MVELRWAIPEGSTADAPRLQYRQCGEWPGAWSEWADVPRVAVKACPGRGDLCRHGCAERECWVKTKQGAASGVGEVDRG